MKGADGGGANALEILDAVCCVQAMGGQRNCRVGQNRIHTLYTTVYLVISLPKMLCKLQKYGSGQPYANVLNM